MLLSGCVMTEACLNSQYLYCLNKSCMRPRRPCACMKNVPLKPHPSLRRIGSFLIAAEEGKGGSLNVTDPSKPKALYGTIRRLVLLK